MSKKENYHYYVEGEDEKSLLNVLKRDCGNAGLTFPGFGAGCRLVFSGNLVMMQLK